jgi:SHS2 domain-containing protein
MSHTFEEHTSEARLRVRAPSLPALFEEAARALAELMCADPGEASGEALRVQARASDREALLAAWIDELVFLSETHKRVWTEAHIERLTDTEVDARVRGLEPSRLRTQVKAATLHELRITQTGPSEYEATMVLDV